jgi:signal transduction histidine kinase
LEVIREKKFDDKDIDDTLDILKNLTQNSSKIYEHGKRADSIINNMLMHSHDKKGVYQDMNLNIMLQEYISLAYHSVVNNYKGFACKIQKELDESNELIKVIPQDLSRVFVNMLNNAFYALYRRKQVEPDFEPVLKIRTVNHPDKFEIVFRDNGLGINPEIMDKIFNPFFTTKPAGEGTGLGLSICYDIIKNIHKGEILVDSKLGEYTEFSVLIPKKQN